MREVFKKEKKETLYLWEEKRRDMCYLFWSSLQSCTWPVYVRVSMSFFRESGMEVKWSENISCELLVLWNGAQVRVSSGSFFWAAELPQLSLCTVFQWALSPLENWPQLSAAVLPASLLETEHLMSDFFRVLSRYHVSHRVHSTKFSSSNRCLLAYVFLCP